MYSPARKNRPGGRLVESFVQHSPLAQGGCVVIRQPLARAGEDSQSRRFGGSVILPRGQMVRVSLSIVVPVFNEELGLGELVKRSCSAAAETVGDNYELILVDDGSDDGTWSAIAELIPHYPNIVAIKLSRNFGHQLALTAGLSAVNGERVLVIDADLQDPPELLGGMVKMMNETGADVVYGLRKSRAGESWLKKQTAHAFYRLLERATNIMIPVDAGDFRLMSRRVSDLIARMPEHDRFIRGMVASVGFKQVPFPYDRQPRFAGVTKYPLSKMLRFATDAFLGYSMVLLRFSSVAAILMLFALLAVAAYSVYSWLYLDVVPGWTSLMMTIITASFFQLVALTVIGEYVGRTYLGSKDRPLFIIDAVRRGEPE